MDGFEAEKKGQKNGGQNTGITQNRGDSGEKCAPKTGRNKYIGGGKKGSGTGNLPLK